MLFNSPVYIFIFLPLVLIIYFLLSKKNSAIARVFLVGSSLFFYSYWNPHYLSLIIISMIVNYFLGALLQGTKTPFLGRKNILKIGIFFNLALLGYYKYADFFIKNINRLAGLDFDLLNLALPLAISFFTFQQIAYLVESYKKKSEKCHFSDYCLFVTFFPQLIAGPIVYHDKLIPQFLNKKNSSVNWYNIAIGLFIFSIGLFKKTVVADFFAVWANAGFDNPNALTFFEAWGATLSYTFQLYYDFSAYSDMAIGGALFFNIHLPINFNSPYKAINIQDFWQRWHITLSGFLRDYVYIPLGGNRKGEARTYINLFITFCIGGFWHGAGWTFIVWGMLHGLALTIHRAWQKLYFNLPKFLSWALTFFFINITWIFFRADSLHKALLMLKGVFSFRTIEWPTDQLTIALNALSLTDNSLNSFKLVIYLLVFSLIAFTFPNSIKVSRYNNENPHQELLQIKIRYGIFISIVLFYSLVVNIRASESQFLYFNF